MLHELHREMTIVMQTIATPSLERSTGCNCEQTVINNALFLGTYEISKEYIKSVLSRIYGPSRHKVPEKMEIQIYLI